MAIFDKELNHIDPQDASGSLRILESYIAYMRERLEFNNTNLTKTLSATGTSSAEMVLVMAALKNSVQALNSSVSSIDGQISGLQSSIETVNSSISSLQTDLQTANSNIKALQTSVADLSARVAALEAAGGTT